MKSHNDAVIIAIQYAKDITQNKILSGHYCKQACKRFLEDLKKQGDEGFPYFLDEDAVQEIIDFAQDLIIPDINKKLELLPWMYFVYCNVWGWKYKADKERRRFRTAFNLLGRKNSKTTSILFPWILYDFISTPSAESYLFSATGDQAIKSFQEITNIIHSNPELEAAFGDSCFSGAITYKSSRISCFSSEATALDGYRNSLTVLDEYFDYATDKPVSAARYGGRARKNSLVAIITTAGTDISSPCYMEMQKAKKILDGTVIDDTYFCCIWGYDETDDWKNPKNLIKANPSLGTILKQDILESDLADALITPSHQADFLAKTCSLFTSGISNWIPSNKITLLGNKEIDFNQFKDIPCYAGLDLSSVNDLTVYSLCWFKDGKYYLKHKVYVPSETAGEKYKTDNINFTEWIQNGLVTVIPGATIDYSYVFNDFLEDAQKFNIKELSYDPWRSKELINRLNDELPHIDFIEFAQNLKNFSEPTKSYEKDILDGLVYDANPISHWCIQNVVIKPDQNGNYKPMKNHRATGDRIDLVISSIMSHDRCKFCNQEKKPKGSLKSVLSCF